MAEESQRGSGWANGPLFPTRFFTRGGGGLLNSTSKADPTNFSRARWLRTDLFHPGWTARKPTRWRTREDIQLVTAIWKDTTIAASDETVLLEGNHYFPPSSVDRSLLQASTHTSVCPIKGTARYFDIRVGSAVNANAAWTYPDPNPVAESIRDHIAFWKGVDVA